MSASEYVVNGVSEMLSITVDHGSSCPCSGFLYSRPNSPSFLCAGGRPTASSYPLTYAIYADVEHVSISFLAVVFGF